MLYFFFCLFTVDFKQNVHYIFCDLVIYLLPCKGAHLLVQKMGSQRASSVRPVPLKLVLQQRSIRFLKSKLLAYRRTLSISIDHDPAGRVHKQTTVYVLRQGLTSQYISASGARPLLKLSESYTPDLRL